jgi:hypothetical protein
MNKSTLLAVSRVLFSKKLSASERFIHAWILLSSGMKIIHGPFAGLRYVSQSAGSAYFPKLLGTYEMELFPIIQAVIKRAPDVIVDAGAAEGYFAVGLAAKSPTSRIYAYDIDFRACYYLDTLASLNHVKDRVVVHCKPCTHQDLEQHLGGATSPFLLMDVEGAEETLLAPLAAPSLLKTEILVELHNTPENSHMLETISGRFEASHKIQSITARARIPSDSPIKLPPFSEVANKALNEGRVAGQRWLYLAPQK